MFLLPHVRWLDVAADVIFLDFKADRYSVASGNSASAWRNLTRGIDGTNPPPDALLNSDGIETGLPIEGFLERGFISPAGAGEPRPGRRRQPGPGPSRVLSAAFLIRRVSRRLGRQGLWPVYEDALRLDPREGARDLDSCLNAFVSGENLSPLRKAPKDCLPRSLALYRFLLGCGIPARHVIGVQSHPFSAHAWVEKDGAALLEVKPPHHRPIARMSPAG